MSALALITGGQQGIGLGIAKALAADGFRLAIASVHEPGHPSVQAALEELGPGARYYRHDLSEIGAIPALLDRIEAEQGPISALVQNAGVPAKVRGDMLEITPENFDFIMDVNLRGAFFLAQDVAKRMLSQATEPYRSITFVTSVERADYCISKAAASMAAQALALRLAPHRIGVFELRPGIIATEMTAGVADTYTARIEGGLVPAARWGQPADIGSVAASIARGDLAFATGAVIPVDGGLSIPRL